jgi:hypothetical protein
LLHEGFVVEFLHAVHALAFFLFVLVLHLFEEDVLVLEVDGLDVLALFLLVVVVVLQFLAPDFSLLLVDLLLILLLELTLLHLLTKISIDLLPLAFQAGLLTSLNLSILSLHLLDILEHSLIFLSKPVLLVGDALVLERVQCLSDLLFAVSAVLLAFVFEGLEKVEVLLLLADFLVPLALHVLLEGLLVQLVLLDHLAQP